MSDLNPALLDHTEEAPDYHHHLATHLDRYQPVDDLDRQLVTELADLTWRLRRLSTLESDLVALEVTRLTTDPELQLALDHCHSESQICSLAAQRLIESNLLPKLWLQEARLSTRIERIRKALEASLPANRPMPGVPIWKNEANPPAAARPLQAIRPDLPGRNDSCHCGSGLKFKRCCLYKPVAAQPPARHATNDPRPEAA